jgi:T5SS/PEP-CTERM-associated repeat protein
VIGSNTSATNYTILTGTSVYSNTIVGLATNSSNNQLIVANTNTLLSNSINLYVGNYGASNSMIITNGGMVTGEYGILGNYSNSSNNSVLVTGAGSIWTNAGDIAVGFDGSGNSLVVSNGGAVLGGTDGVGGIIGADIPSSNNSVLVTGSNSSWSNSLDLYVGFAGNNNSLTISNSAVVHDANGFIGNYYLSSNNVVQVTGTNSLWSNVGNLYVGNSGSSNSLVISNAGRVNDSNAYIGFDVTGNPSNNSVTVTGTNSTWSNSGNLYVGFEGSNNSMVISNGGKVADGNGYIGHTNTSSNNSVLVTGIGSLWSNRVTLTIAASNTLTVANGGTVVAGGGITNSGTLTGNGTIGGATTIASGGTLTPGSGGVGSLTFTNGLSLQTGATITFQINTKADFTSINILGNSITYGGKLVFNILNYTPAAGDAFSLFNMTGGATESGDFNTVTAGSLSFLNNGGIWSANNGYYLYQFSDSTGQLTVQSAPEPSTYALFGIGAIGLLMVIRRKKAV